MLLASWLPPAVAAHERRCLRKYSSAAVVVLCGGLGSSRALQGGLSVFARGLRVEPAIAVVVEEASAVVVVVTVSLAQAVVVPVGVVVQCHKTRQCELEASSGG